MPRNKKSNKSNGKGLVFREYVPDVRYIYSLSMRIGARDFNTVIDTGTTISKVSAKVMSYLAELGIHPSETPGKKKIKTYLITAHVDDRKFILCAYGKQNLSCDIRLGVQSLGAIGMIIDYQNGQRWYRDDPERVINFEDVANGIPMWFPHLGRLQHPDQAKQVLEKPSEVVDSVVNSAEPALQETNSAEPQETVTPVNEKRKKKRKVDKKLLKPQVNAQLAEAVVNSAESEETLTEDKSTEVNESQRKKRKEVVKPETDAEAKPVKKKVRKGRLSEAEAINVILSSVPEGYANPWQS